MTFSLKSRRPSIFALAAACALAGQPLTRAIEIAGDLLIELDAADFMNGSSIWTQNYSNRPIDTGIVGNFTAFGNPTVQTVGGALGVLFDGQDYFTGPLSTYSSPIDGLNPTRTIEVWVYQGNLRLEETMVSWGRRGTNGGNLAFNYSASTGPNGFGAVAHHGTAGDLGWNVGEIPAAGQWHHIVYTMDGGTSTKIYVDGTLAVSEALSLGTINTIQDLTINLGAQRNTAGTEIDVRVPDAANILFSGAIGKVRIHSGALGADEVAANFEAEKSLFTAGVEAMNATRAPIFRWSFNEAADVALDGTTMLDEVSGVAAKVRGAGAVFTGTSIDLPGGSSDTQAYVDLPNGILSSKEAVSIELWYTSQENRTWSRVFDFGTTTIGEISGPGGSFTGQSNLFLTNNRAGTTEQRFARATSSGQVYRDTLATTVTDIEVHVVVTYDPNLQEWHWYRNGILQEVLPDAEGPRTLADVNNWLGRSNFGSDQNTNALYNEVRIYNYRLSEGEILGNFTSGPDSLLTVAATLAWTPRDGGTFAYNNASGQNNWGTGAGGTFPGGVDATATIVGDFTGDQEILLNAPVTVGLLALGDTDMGEKLTIGAGTGGSLSFEVSSGIAGLVQSSGSAGDIITAPVVFSSQTEIATYSSQPLVISGPTSGVAGITKSTAGTLVLTGNNGYQGATRVNGGILQVGDGGTSGTLPAGGDVILKAGTSLVFDRADAHDVTSNISGAGTFIQNSTGELTIGGVIAITGQTQLLEGSTNITGTISSTSSLRIYNDTTFASGSSVTATNLLIDNHATFDSGSSVTVNTYGSIGVVDGGSATIKEGATFNVTNEFNVGDIQFGSSTLTIEGGNVTLGNLYVGKGMLTSGFVFQSGGTVQRGPSGEVRIGGNTTADITAYGYYGLTGGTFRSDGNFQVGAYGYGVMEVDGGSFSVGGWHAIGRFAGGKGVMNVSSGSFTHTGANPATNSTTRIIVAEAGYGVLNVSDAGSVTAVSGILVGSAAGGVGIVNLNGGTIETQSIHQVSGGASEGVGWGEINFNGGTLRPTGDNAGFMQGIDAAYVRSGGAKIDPNGYNITINQPLLAPTGDGVISIPVLDGGEGYLSAPLVEITAFDGGTGATAVAEVSDGVVTGITITNPGIGYTIAPSVTLVGGGASNPALADSGILAPNATTGGLTIEGAGSVTLAAANTYQGPSTVTEAELVVTGSLSATASVEVNGGGVLRLGNNEVINDSASVTLSGGTLATAGFSEKLGTLSIELGSTIDLGFGLSTLSFDDSSSAVWSGTLTILNWSGWDIGGGNDQIFFGNSASGLTNDQLQLISFVNPEGFEAGSYNAQILPTGEIVPIPEPTGVAMLALGMATVIGLRRRRSEA